MSSVERNSAIMASGTAASRITGQVRTILLAAALGTTGIAADAYQTGAMIPQVMFTLISGGIFNAVLVPQIVRTLKEKDAQDRLNKLITVAMALLAAITVVLMLGTPVLTTIYLNSSWTPAERALANAFTLWCMPQVFFYGLYTILGQILAAKGRFTAYAWSSVGANIISCAGFVAFIVLFGNARNRPLTFWTEEKVALTAGAWTLGVGFQALVLFIPLIMSGFRYRPRWGVRGIGLRSMGPVAAWSLGVVVINQLANIVNARITTGAPRQGLADVAGNGSYQNAYTLFILPYSLIAVSVSTAIFPRLSEHVSDGHVDQAREELSKALRNVGLMMFFFCTVMLAIPVPITRALLPSVSVKESILISGPLLGLTLGLVAMSAFLLIQRTFYAFEDGRHPFIFAVIYNLLQVALVLVSIRLISPKYWATMVGLSLTLGYILSFPVMIHMLRGPFGGHLDGKRIMITYGKGLLAALAALAACLLIKSPLTHLVGAAVSGQDGHMSWVQALAVCVVTTLVAAAVYGLVLRALKTEEFMGALAALKGWVARFTSRGNKITAVREVGRIVTSRAGDQATMRGHAARVIRSSTGDSTQAVMDAAMDELNDAFALTGEAPQAPGRAVDAGGPDTGNGEPHQPVRIIPKSVHARKADPTTAPRAPGQGPVTAGSARATAVPQPESDPGRGGRPEPGSRPQPGNPGPSAPDDSAGRRADGGRGNVSKENQDTDATIPGPDHDESLEKMTPSIGDTVLDRYTLVALLRQAPGLGVWRATDKVLARDCQLFIVNDSAFIDQVNTTASGLALRKNHRFTPVYQLHTRDGISLVITGLDAGMSLRSYMQGPAARTLSNKAIRTIAGEITEAGRSLRQAGLEDYAVSTDTVRLASTGATLADAPISSLIEPVGTGRDKTGPDEEESTRQIAAILYAMLTGRPVENGEKYSLKALPEGTPEEFRIVCARGLGLRDDHGVLPIPLVTLAELSALLGPWVPPEELGDDDITWPEMTGAPSISKVTLKPAKQEDLLPIPASVTGRATGGQSPQTQAEPQWGTNQLLFPGRSEIEMLNPDDADSDLFSLFDERQRLGGGAGGPQPGLTARPASHTTDALDVRGLRAGLPQDILNQSTGRMSPISGAGDRNGIRGAEQPAGEDPIEHGFPQWDFNKPGASGAGDDKAGGPSIFQPVPAQPGPSASQMGGGREQGDSHGSPAQVGPIQAGGEQEGVYTDSAVPLPPSFTPEPRPAPSPIGYAADSADEEELDEDDVADARLFGRFTTRSVVISIAAVIVVVALVWALATVIGHRPASSSGQDGSWPVMSNVPFPGKTQDESSKAKDQSESVKHDEKDVSKVPAPKLPENTVPYPITNEIFLSRPGGLQGYGMYIHLKDPQLVSRVEMGMPIGGGHAQIFVDSTPGQPNQGEPQADFSFDPSGTTKVTLHTPKTTQDLVIWVPVDGLPGNHLRFNTIRVY